MEPSFFKVKAYVHREGQAFRTATKADNDKLEVLTQLHNAVYSITPRDAEGWFRHSGYFQCIESFKKILGVSIAKKMWM
jgi:hypothetical protein